jgi:hypothetical protein
VWVGDVAPSAVKTVIVHFEMAGSGGISVRILTSPSALTELFSCHNKNALYGVHCSEEDI